MLILGIETSCDETAAAVLNDGVILSNVIYSQIAIHARYGGVVPELAGRSHLETIHTVIRQSIDEARVSLSDMDLIAVTSGPGLVCSLLVGINTAKGIAYALNKPIIGVNHLEGHMLAIFLHDTVKFPFMALIVSGGHTDLCRIDDFGVYRFLGRTRDDAAGECFDKVAKMMGLGYPGGPAIEALARSGDPEAHAFPRAWLEKGSLDFSFSGLKTSVRNLLQKRREGRAVVMDNDIAASFQKAVTDVLVTKLIAACQNEGLDRAVVTGGVASNTFLRDQVDAATRAKGIECYFPRKDLCTDNAAMIACAGFHKFRGLEQDNVFLLDAHANLSL